METKHYPVHDQFASGDPEPSGRESLIDGAIIVALPCSARTRRPV